MTTGVPDVPHIPSADIMAVTLSSRIPEFWVDQPRVWFIRVEAILAPQKMSDDARFDIVVAKLPKDVIVQLSDFLAKPPESGKFQALKTKMLTLFEESTNRQIEKLIGEMELGDQKPSQKLLHRMRDLARDKIPDDTLRVLWQGHLPTTVRAVLTVAETKGLDNLAMIADNVAEATRVPQVSEVSQKSPKSESSKVTTDIEQLTAEIAKINATLTNMQRGRSRSKSNNRSPRRFSRSSSRYRTPDSPDWLCSYHFRYRHRANRCVPPCAWKPRDYSKKENDRSSQSEN